MGKQLNKEFTGISTMIQSEQRHLTERRSVVTFLIYLLITVILLALLSYLKRVLILIALFFGASLIGGFAVGAVAVLVLYIYYLRRYGGLIDSSGTKTE